MRHVISFPIGSGIRIAVCGCDGGWEQPKAGKPSTTLPYQPVSKVAIFLLLQIVQELSLLGNIQMKGLAR